MKVMWFHFLMIFSTSCIFKSFTFIKCSSLFTFIVSNYTYSTCIMKILNKLTAVFTCSSVSTTTLYMYTLCSFFRGCIITYNNTLLQMIAVCVCVLWFTCIVSCSSIIIWSFSAIAIPELRACGSALPLGSRTLRKKRTGHVTSKNACFLNAVT